MIKRVVCTNASSAAEYAARQIAAAVRSQPNIVLGLATGETMRPLYAELVRDHVEAGTCWVGVSVFNLDDYVGVAIDHPASFRRFMRETLFDRIDIDPSHCFMPDGTAADLERDARDYEERISAAGGIDLQLLGIGRNAHIAFNEPGSGFDSRTRVVDLAATTREAALPAFGIESDIPKRGVTMGIGTILQARRILLVAIGADKTAAVADTCRAPADLDRPASALQSHRDVTLILDASAAETLD